MIDDLVTLVEWFLGQHWRHNCIVGIDGKKLDAPASSIGTAIVCLTRRGGWLEPFLNNKKIQTNETEIPTSRHQT
jgi:hypothetical protein